MQSDPTMKSLQIGMHWFPQGGGGADRYVHGLVGALQARELSCDTVVFGQPDAEISHVQFLANRGLLHRLRDLRRVICHSDADVVVSHFGLYALPGLDVLRRRPFVVQFHGPWAAESAAEGASPLVVRAKHLVESSVYAAADRFITLSEAFADVLIRSYQVNPKTVRVIPGGVDTSAFASAPDRATSRAALGWPAHRRIVLCVRRLQRRMGIEMLIEAAGILRTNFPDLLVLIAGRGSEQAMLARRIEDAGLQDLVRLIGFVPDADLPMAYAAADCTVMPSVALEGFGLAAVESLAAGTPCLGTPVGGLPELLSGLDARLVFANPSADAIAGGLDDWLSDADPLSCQQCRDYAIERFDWQVVLPKILDVYEEAVCDR